MEEGTLIIDAYKRAATSTDVPIWNYKGLEIHAFPATHDEVVDATSKYVNRGAKILDVGSGSGALCLRLHDEGFSVVGCDIVHENFKLHDKVPFVLCNLNQDFADVFTERFAAIAATEIIEHIENPRHFLRQCFSLLQPGGVLILTTPNIDSRISRAIFAREGRFWCFDDTFYRNDGHITPVPIFLLNHALAEVGFEVIQLVSVGEFGGSFFSWWKMHIFAQILRIIEKVSSPQGPNLLVICKRPTSPIAR